MLTKDQILAADDLQRVEVPVPEWGGSVFVRTMSGSERDRFEAAHLKNPERDFRARLAVACVCDEQGQPLFAEADIPSLGGKSSSALTRIFEAASKLNRMSKEDYEDLGKGSRSDPSDSSPTGSL
jgi:hypothetical protein